MHPLKNPPMKDREVYKTMRNNILCKYGLKATAFVMAFGLIAGCGKADDAGSAAVSEKGSREEQSQTKEDDGAIRAGSFKAELTDRTDAVSGKTSQDNKPEEEKVSEEETEGLSSVDFVAAMGNGWNLGNEFDAADCDWLSDPMEYEGAWCKAKASNELIDAVHSAGFDTIRIPVSWHDHMDGAYNIDDKWLARVTEIVDHAYDSGMYVIIDSHHDVTPAYYYPSKDKLEQSERFMEAVWTRLSDNFKDYGERLIFESINEPRLKDTGNEWWYDESQGQCRDAMECIVCCNQVFVDTVRKSGGNNATRFLMVPSYDDAWQPTVNDAFTLPKDSASDKLIVTAHLYLPYDFAGNPDGTKTFGDNEKAENEKALAALEGRFVSKGIGVYIGEYGAENKGNNSDQAAYYAYFPAAARKYGMSCAAWDNNVFETSSASTQGYGIFSYGDAKVVRSDITDAISGR